MTARPDPPRGGRRVDYPAHMKLMLDAVMTVEAHLWNDAENALFETYKSLEYQAQALYLQLFQRRRGWLRVESLHYHHIGDISQQLSILCAAGLCSDAGPESLDELIALATVDELRQAAQLFPAVLRRCTGKDAMAAALLKRATRPANHGLHRFFAPTKAAAAKRAEKRAAGEDDATRLAAELRRIQGQLVLVKPEPSELFARVCLVYARHREHEPKPLVTYIMQTTERVQYPVYQCRRSADVFPTRDACIEYAANLPVAAAAHRAGHESDWDALARLVAEHRVEERWAAHAAQELPPALQKMYHLRQFHPAWPLTRILEDVAEMCEKQRRYDDAARMYGRLLAQDRFLLHHAGRWYDRLALIQQRYLGDPPGSDDALRTSLATCRAALGHAFVLSGDMAALGRRIRALEKRLHVPLPERSVLPLADLVKPPERTFAGVRASSDAVAAAGTVGSKSLWVGPDDTVLTVEELALTEYARLGYTLGFHSENAILPTLFGILFWDILFQPLPGVLEHEHQTHPLDLLSDSFYHSRAAAVEERLAELSRDNGELAERLALHDAQFRGQSALGVHWDAFQAAELQLVVAGMGACAVAAVCRLFAESYKQHSGGMPDLCLYSPADRRTLFVEVKGPGDRLSDKQRLWLGVLSSSGSLVEVCRVTSG